MAELLVVFLATMLSSGVGAYVGAYLKRKGENPATHEDIDKLLDQVAAGLAPWAETNS